MKIAAENREPTKLKIELPTPGKGYVIDIGHDEPIYKEEKTVDLSVRKKP